jgi:membrane protease YdiL (CAAX protease family)
MFLAAFLLVALTAYTAVWIYRDAASHGSRIKAALWGSAVFTLFPLAFPLYTLAARPRNPAAPLWSILDVVAVGSLVVVTLPFVVTVHALTVGDVTLDFTSVSVLIVVQSFVFVAGALYVARRYGLTPAAIGYRADTWRSLTATSILVSIPVIIGAHYVVQPASIWLVGLFTGQDQARLLAEAERLANPILQVLPPLDDPIRVLLFAILVCALVPVAEETFFRGFAYPPLRRRYGRVAGMIITSLVFAAVHVQVINFLPIALLGFVMVVMYDRSGSLLPPTILHTLNNAVALTLAYT